MPEPLITAIVDTFNHQDYIERAINSVFEQGLSAADLEVIVVDDGSTDGTQRILEKFRDRARIVLKTNGGQASALNAAISLARGEIVAFLDGDDYWAGGKLKTIVEVFQRNPSIGAVGHGIYEMNAMTGEQLVVIPNAERHVSLKSVDDAVRFRDLMCFLGTSRVAIRRRVLSGIGPIPDSLIVEADEFMSTMAVAQSGAILLQTPLTFYRLHARNLYQFARGDQRQLKRKLSALQSLGTALRNELPRTGIGDGVIAAVVEPIEAEAQRLKLSIMGGRSWETFQVERANFRLARMQANRGYALFKGVVLLFALILPPKIFYRLRAWYARMNLRRLRNVIGEPIPVDPLLYYGRDDGRWKKS